MSSSMHIVREALRGKTLGRILTNQQISMGTSTLRGKVLDLGGGKSPSYLRLLPQEIQLVRTDRIESQNVTAVDFNKKLPFEDSSFDGVLLFNALYAADDPSHVANEVHRVLKSNATWSILSPFVANEMREPHDYLRFTAEGLERLLKDSGFDHIEIVRVGERASAATHLMHPFFLFRFVRAIAFPIAVFLDGLIPARVRLDHPTPISYFVMAHKPL